LKNSHTQCKILIRGGIPEGWDGKTKITGIKPVHKLVWENKRYWELESEDDWTSIYNVGHIENATVQQFMKDCHDGIPFETINKDAIGKGLLTMEYAERLVEYML
jgi:hypothetical protein